jgi:hypothetical protein
MVSLENRRIHAIPYSLPYSFRASACTDLGFEKRERAGGGAFGVDELRHSGIGVPQDLADQIRRDASITKPETERAP